jgi:hypothetical protein
VIANLTAVMDGLAALASAAGLAPDVYAWPVDSITVPCVVVGYPSEILFDLTFQRGGDELTVPVWYVVGDTSTKDARDRLSTIVGDASSVKSALDGAQAFGDVRVVSAAVERITVGSIAYLAVRFDAEII